MNNYSKYKTHDERMEAFREYSKHSTYLVKYAEAEAYAKWLEMEALPDSPLPCPFCGKNYVVVVPGEKTNWHKDRFAVECYNMEDECCYRGPWKASEAEAVEAHNRVAREVFRVRDKKCSYGRDPMVCAKCSTCEKFASKTGGRRVWVCRSSGKIVLMDTLV